MKKGLKVMGAMMICIMVLTAVQVGCAADLTGGHSSHQQALAQNSVANVQEKAPSGKRPAILFVGTPSAGIIGYYLYDQDLKAKLNEAGYEVGQVVYERLTWDVLKQFNVVVMIQEPVIRPEDPVAKRNYEVFREKEPLLNRFVEEGGGLFIHADTWTDTINRFIKKYDGKIGVGDPRMARQIIESNEDNIHAFDNIFKAFHALNANPDSPVTEGVNAVAIPLILSNVLDESQMSDDWVIDVRGNATTRVQVYNSDEGKYDVVIPENPPFFAHRQYEKGRLYLFPSHSTNWSHNGYHPKWDSGYCFTYGDGLKFYMNIMKYLSAPSMKESTLGGFVEADQDSIMTKEEFFALGNAFPEVPLDQQGMPAHVYKGIIGPRTNLSTGTHTVKEFCDAAKDAGYNFVIFAEENPSAENFQTLRELCEAQSTEDFIAIAGVEFVSNDGVKDFMIGLYEWHPEWPDPVGQAIGGVSHYWVTSHQNPRAPWQRGAIMGMEVYGYDDDMNVTSDASFLFDYLQRKDWFLVPLAMQRFTDPESIKEFDGYYTSVVANNVDEIYERLRQHKKTAFITEGPEVSQFWMEGPGLTQDAFEGQYYMWQWSNPDDYCTIHIDVASDADLTDVTLYRDNKVIYSVDPDSSQFSQDYILMTDNNASNYWLKVTDENGSHALTTNLRTRANRYWAHQGGDRMNTYSNNFLKNDKYGVWYFRDGLYHSIGGNYFGQGWGNYCDIYGPAIPGWIWTPSGQEVGTPPGGAARIFPHPRVKTDHGTEIESPTPFITGYSLASSDCNYIEFPVTTRMVRTNEDGNTIYRNVGTDYLDTKSRFTFFKWKAYGVIAPLVEIEAFVKNDIQLADDEGLEIELLTFPFEPWSKNVLTSYGYIDENGEKIVSTGHDFKGPSTVLLNAALDEYGWVGAWPDPWGNLAIASVDGKSYDVSVSTAPALSIGYDRDGAIIPAGTVLKGKFALMYTTGEEEDATEVFDTFRSQYGIGGPPSYTIDVKQGTLLDTTFILHLEAQQYAASMDMNIKPTYNGIYALVDGLNDRWDCGMYNVKTRELIRMPVVDGQLHKRIDATGEASIVLGNIFYCENDEMVINLVNTPDEGYVLRVNNPSDKTATVTIRNQEDFDLFGDVAITMTLDAGQTGYVNLEAR